MKKTEDDEMQILTDKKRGTQDEIMDIIKMASEAKRKKKNKIKEKNKKKGEEDEKKEEEKQEKNKNVVNNSLFDIVGRYNLIKMLGSGSFGEIHLAFDTQTTQLCAIKFELAIQKNPQLKHESNILEQLNRIDSKDNQNLIPDGIPKLFNFEKIENKCNFMVMEFLGPSLADLFQFKLKRFTKTTVLLLGIQLLQRIEYMHEKGFIHRDIKPENFVIGLNDKSSTVYIIDFGLSKRYKDKNTGQHIPYRENRHLVGTARYASINAHLGIEQSRRDDIESIGYVLVYFMLGRLPWQSKNEKNKQPAKILEKKLLTPPEILCKKLPSKYFI
jgi:serine/threonine protein kinase